MAKVSGKAGKKKSSAMKNGDKVRKGYKTDRGGNPFSMGPASSGATKRKRPKAKAK